MSMAVLIIPSLATFKQGNAFTMFKESSLDPLLRKIDACPLGNVVSSNQNQYAFNLGISAPFILCLVSGIINVDSYNRKKSERWEIRSDCSKVRIVSTQLDVVPTNTITIGGTTYKGQIDHGVLSGWFNVSFERDIYATRTGFTLQWECITEGLY